MSQGSESAPEELQLFPGELHITQSTKFCSSLQKYFICMQQDKLVAKHLYSSKTSPFSRIHYMHFEMSATWPLCLSHGHSTSELGCFAAGMTTTSRDTKSTLPLSLSARYCCCPLPPPACMPLQAVCQCWKSHQLSAWPETQPENSVCMFVAPQGILSQVQLYWLKHLPQENSDTEALMGPYILGLCNSLFYLFIVLINKNASLTTEMNFLSNYSHFLWYISL